MEVDFIVNKKNIRLVIEVWIWTLLGFRLQLRTSRYNVVYVTLHNFLLVVA